VELLLDLNREILSWRAKIRRTRLLRRVQFALGMLAAGLIAACWAATAVTWGRVDLAAVNFPCLVVVGLCAAGIVKIAQEFGDGGYTPVPQLELELEVAEERRRLYAASLNLPVEVRRFAYRDSVPREVTGLRQDGDHYRRVHNALQSVIIIGSIATSTAAGLSDVHPALRWVTVGVGLAVGISAGFTGYFKFRERSFYLQQTADAIEQEVSAVDLRIGSYAGKGDELAMAEFTERVEFLKTEQRKRQQQLDQPAEGRDGVV